MPALPLEEAPPLVLGLVRAGPPVLVLPPSVLLEVTEHRGICNVGVSLDPLRTNHSAPFLFRGKHRDPPEMSVLVGAMHLTAVLE